MAIRRVFIAHSNATPPPTMSSRRVNYTVWYAVETGLFHPGGSAAGVTLPERCGHGFTSRPISTCDRIQESRK